MKPRPSGAAPPSRGSPPTRGAWIETVQASRLKPAIAVAPHAGGVD